MLIAMEGSSPTIRGENNRKYYVWNVHEQTPQSPKTYIEGPATFSMEGSPVSIASMSDEAVAFARCSVGPILLVGWSRGAAACVQVAHDLNTQGGMEIEAMFLFDAVDQDTSTDLFLNFIPGNVKNAYHAIATDKNWFWSRIFPTCAREAAHGVNFVTQEFHATHGGIAGAGETDAGSWDWMLPHMQRHGAM